MQHKIVEFTNLLRKSGIRVSMAESIDAFVSLDELSLDDREIFARDYTKLLAEMRFARHYDPKTGKPDGVEIKDVPKDSFGAKYGAKAGQVIQSINGHPVSSVNEGISYAKQNADKYKIWEIVYVEQGKEKTKIIDTSEN